MTTPTDPKAARVWRALEEMIPTPRCELDFQNAFELLIATILAAQSNDKTINRVTPALFARCPTPAAMAAAPIEELEALVHATGFFRNKARAIQETSRQLTERFGGEVPRDLDALVSLRGVARKTANVVLGTAYRIASGVIVDVHVTRVSQRLGLTTAKQPEKIEQDLQRLFPKDTWIDLGHRMVLHGRYTCLARKPRCDACACEPFCPSSALRAAPAARR